MRSFSTVILLLGMLLLSGMPQQASAAAPDSAAVRKKLCRKYDKVRTTRRVHDGYYYFVANKRNGNLGLYDSLGNCILKPQYSRLQLLDDVVIRSQRKKKQTLISVVDYEGNPIITTKAGYDYYKVDHNVVALSKSKKHDPSGKQYTFYTADFKKHIDVELDHGLLGSSFHDDFFVLDYHDIYNYNLDRLVRADVYDFILSPVTNTIWGKYYRDSYYSRDYGIGPDGKQKYGKNGKFVWRTESAKIYAGSLKARTVYAEGLVGIFQDSATLKILDIVTGDSVVCHHVTEAEEDTAGHDYFDVVFDSGYYRFSHALESPRIWDNAWSAGSKYTVAVKDGKKALFEGMGCKVSFGEYDAIFTLGESDYFFTSKDSAGVGLYNADSGKELVPPKYDGLSFTDYLILAKDHDSYGAYNWKGELMVEPYYDSVIAEDKLILLKQDGKYGAIGWNKIFIADTKYDTVFYDSAQKCFVCQTGKYEKEYVKYYKGHRYSSCSYNALNLDIEVQKYADALEEERAQEEAARRAAERRAEAERQERERQEAIRQQELQKQQAWQDLAYSLNTMGQAISNAGRNTNANYSNNSSALRDVTVLRVSIVNNKAAGTSYVTVQMDSQGNVWVGGQILGRNNNINDSWGVSSSRFRYWTTKPSGTGTYYAYFWN